MLKPSPSAKSVFNKPLHASSSVVTAAGVLFSVGLVMGLTGCGQQDQEQGLLTDSIDQLHAASEVAIPAGVTAGSDSAEALASLMEEDQIAARRAALKEAEAGLKQVVSGGSPQEQKAARLLLTRVRLADADASITQVRGGVPAVIALASEVRAKALGFEAAYNQVVRKDPNVDAYLTIMAAAVQREQGAVQDAETKVAALEGERSKQKAQIGEHQSAAQDLGKSKAQFARELMTAEGRQAFILNNASGELTLKINAEQTQIAVLEDQVRLVEDQISLTQAQAAAAESAIQQYQSMAAEAKQAAEIDLAARDAFRTTLDEAGASVSESLKAMVDAYQVQVHGPLGQILTGLDDADGADAFTEVELASAKLEAMVVDTAALQSVVDALETIQSVAAAQTSGSAEVSGWRVASLSGATDFAEASLGELKPLLGNMRQAAVQLADATREKINPMRGDGDDGATQAANNYYKLVSYLKYSVSENKAKPSTPAS